MVSSRLRRLSSGPLLLRVLGRDITGLQYNLELKIKWTYHIKKKVKI
jgi:hypothetical protein